MKIQTYTPRRIRIEGRKSEIRPFIFHDLDNAIDYAYRGLNRYVIMGDAPEYWIVNGSEAKTLLKAGYQGIDIKYNVYRD